MKKHANRVNLGSRILNAKETDRLQRIHEKKIQEARKKGVCLCVRSLPTRPQREVAQAL
jgi:hypothetical protein